MCIPAVDVGEPGVLCWVTAAGIVPAAVNINNVRNTNSAIIINNKRNYIL